MQPKKDQTTGVVYTSDAAQTMMSVTVLPLGVAIMLTFGVHGHPNFVGMVWAGFGIFELLTVPFAIWMIARIESKRTMGR